MVCREGRGQGEADRELLQGCFIQDEWLFKPGQLTNMQMPLLEVHVQQGLLQIWNCQESLVHVFSRDEQTKKKGFKHNYFVGTDMMFFVLLLLPLFLTAVLFYYSFNEIEIFKLFFFLILFPILKIVNLLSEYAVHSNTWWPLLGNVCYLKKRFQSIF